VPMPVKLFFIYTYILLQEKTLPSKKWFAEGLCLCYLMTICSLFFCVHILDE
jgi:hypothetical protein